MCCRSLWSARVLYNGSSWSRYVAGVTIKNFSIITIDRTFNRRVDLSLLHWFAFCGVGSSRTGYLGATTSRREHE